MDGQVGMLHRGPEAGKPHAKRPRITDLLPMSSHPFKEQSQAHTEFKGPPQQI